MEKRMIREGRGFHLASEESLVTVRISRLIQRQDALEYDVNVSENDVQTDVVCGSPPDNTLTSNWLHDCIQTMKPGEVSQFKTPPDVHTNSTTSMNESESIPGYELELISLKRVDDVWKWPSERKLERARQLKARGVDCYRADDMRAAELNFSRSLRFIIAIGEREASEEIRREGRNLRCACYLNLAACQLSRKLYTHVIENCSKALDIEPHNVKGLFRRGRAYVGVSDYGVAREDFRLALSIEPNNRAIKEQMVLLESKQRERDAEYRRALGKMFSNQHCS